MSAEAEKDKVLVVIFTPKKAERFDAFVAAYRRWFDNEDKHDEKRLRAELVNTAILLGAAFYDSASGKE